MCAPPQRSSSENLGIHEAPEGPFPGKEGKGGHGAITSFDVSQGMDPLGNSSCPLPFSGPWRGELDPLEGGVPVFGKRFRAFSGGEAHGLYSRSSGPPGNFGRAPEGCLGSSFRFSKGLLCPRRCDGLCKRRDISPYCAHSKRGKLLVGGGSRPSQGS